MLLYDRRVQTKAFEHLHTNIIGENLQPIPSPFFRSSKTLIARISRLRDQIYHITEQSKNQNQSIIPSPFNSLSSKSLDEINIQLLTRAKERFLCRTAILFTTNPITDEFNHFLVGASIGPVVNFLSNQFKTKSLATGHFTSSPGDIFDTFGYGDTLCYNFHFEQSEKNIECLLWLGYPRHTSPSILEKQWAQDVANALSIHLSLFSNIKSSKSNNSLSGSANKEKQDISDEFVAHISHDLRAPLNNIKAVLHLLDLQINDNDTRELINLALSNCGQLRDLINNVLDLYKHEKQSLLPSIIEIDLNKVVTEISQSFKPSFLAKNIKYELQIAPESLFIVGDETHLRRILTNIISNSLKYTPSNGTVKINLSQSSLDKATVIVSDSGCGIAQKDLEKIFLPFFRSPQAQMEDGLGLGLTLTKALVEQNKGTIKISSKLGEGTEVYLTFSLLNTELCRDQSSIIIIDDDADAASSLKRILEISNLSAECCNSVQELREIITFLRPKIIISDYSLGDGTIHDIINLIDFNMINTKIILLTGGEDKRILHKGIPIIYFQKPLDPQAIIKVINESLMQG